MAGPEAGHAFPAFALAERAVGAGHQVTVYTGPRWLPLAVERGLTVAELPALTAQPGDDDDDAGAKLSIRAARMAVALAPLLAAAETELVISDVITVAGGWAADLCGLPWIELSPHPLYAPSRGLPPIGAGLAPGTGPRGRLRDTILRAMTARAVKTGERQRVSAREEIGLAGPGEPSARFIATLPGLEPARPDWPADTHLIGPLFFEPTVDELTIPDGDAPLVLICPSTAETGATGMAEHSLAAVTALARQRPLRVVYSALTLPGPEAGLPPGAVAGLGRQDLLLAAADAVICGGGHGLLAKALSAGVPVVTVPGGGDQWELASRVDRLGAGIAVRPAGAEAIAQAVAGVLDAPSYARTAAGIAATAEQTVDPLPLIERLLRRTACA